MSGTNVLSRSLKGEHGPLNSTQLRMDAVLEGITKEGLSVKSLLPMFAGSFVFKFSRLAVLGISSSKFAQGASYGLALLSEASAFDFSSRILSPSSSENFPDFSHRVAGNMFRFGILRGSHVLINPAYPILSHFVTSSAMLAGENVAASLGFGLRNSVSLFEQLAEAEMSNLQMQFSMASLHFLFPSAFKKERSLDLQIQARVHFSPHENILREKEIKFFPSMAAEGTSPLKVLWCSEEQLKTPAEPRSMRALWKRVNEKLHATEKLFEGLVSPEQLRDVMPDSKDVHEIWFHQMKDFVRSVGGTWTMKPAGSLLEPDFPQERWQEKRILADALDYLKKQGLGEVANQVLELDIPYEEVRFGREWLEGQNTELAYILGQMTGSLGNRVRLVENSRNQGKIIARIPSIVLLEALQRKISGKSFTPFVYVKGKISRDLISRIRTQGYAPIGLSRTAPLLGDIGVKVHPWFFTLHDLYHASGLSDYSALFREFIGQHYERLRQTTFFNSPYLETHLDRLVDFDPANDREGKIQNYLAYSLSYIPERIFEGEKDPPAFLLKTIKYRGFWTSYLDWLNRCPPDLEYLPYHADLKRGVTEIVQNLDAIFRKTMDEIRENLEKSRKQK